MPGGVRVGVGYIQVKPDLSGFGQKLKSEVGRDLSEVGRDASQKLGKNLGGARGALSKFTGELGSAGLALKAGFAGAAGVAATKVVAFAAAAVEAASSINEATSATRVIFGEYADQVLKFSEQSAAAIGVSKLAALETADRFGNLLLALGATPESAAAASTSLIRVAADVASLYKIAGGGEAVAEKFMSGLVGETEPLRAIGIVINETTVKTKALELGLGGANRELTEGEKLSARYALIMDGTSRAQGDFARTSENLANAQLSANARMEDAKATLGEGLVPVVTYGTVALIGLITKLQELGAAAGKITNLGILGVDLGEVAKQAAFAAMPGLRLVDWIHSAGEESVTTGADLGALATTIELAAQQAAAAQSEIDGMKASIFGLADAQRAQAQASKAVARADQDLGDARETLNELLRDGAVDEERVADARERLNDATRSLNKANRELARSQEAYNDAQAAYLALPIDTNADALRDAEFGLADAQDSVADAAARQKDAAKELAEAQAGDPEFQDKLAAARRRVEDATTAVADAEYGQAKATYTLDEATKKANTSMAAHADAVAKIRGEWETLLALQPSIGKFLAGPLGIVGPAPAPGAAAGAEPFAPSPSTTPDWWSSDYLAWHQARYPTGQPGSVAAPTAPASTTTNNITVNVTEPVQDPGLIGKAIAWVL